MNDRTANQQLGRIAYRHEGDWWVAYYALPNTMEGALELARIKMAFVATDRQRKDAFMKLIQDGIATIVPEFSVVEQRAAPESERSGHG